MNKAFFLLISITSAVSAMDHSEESISPAIMHKDNQATKNIHNALISQAEKDDYQRKENIAAIGVITGAILAVSGIALENRGHPIGKKMFCAGMGIVVVTALPSFMQQGKKITMEK